MSKWRKIVSFLMTVFMLLSTAVQVFAGTSLETALNKVNLYVKQEAGAQLLTWKGIIDAENFAPAIIVYKADDGKEYPAFCANPNRPGVENHSSRNYDVDVDQLDTDPAVWGVITNGYPYKSPEELGVNTEYEAYYVTKMAVWAVVHDNYSNLDDWQANGEQNAHVEKAMKDLVAKGKENQYVYTTWLAANPKTPSVGTDNIDGSYLSQEYNVESNVDIKSYRIELKGNIPEGVKITDINNNEKDSFDGSEPNFKVLIPVSSAENEGEFEVIVKGKLENKSVLFGLSHDAKKQDYYVAPLPTYNGDTWAQLAYGEPGDNTDTPDIPDADSSLQILKVAAGTTKGLAGAVFKVEVDGKTIGHYVTDKNGEIQIDNISGTVSITEEVPPEGYVLDENNHKDVEIINSDKPTVVTFSNEKIAELEIKKVDADTGEGLSNAVIRVAMDGGSDSYDVYTNASGTATLTNLKSGTYTVTEIVSPEGYILNDTPTSVKLEAGKTASITLENHAKPGLVIKKYDEDTGYPLPDAEFSISKKEGSIVYEGMTDKSGQIRIEGLDEGWYTITEIAAPKGYLIAQESKDVYLDGGKCVEVKFDNRLRPSLQLMKIDAETNKPLSGAKFKVTKTEDKTVSEYITDETGTVVIRDLDEAVYTVEEIEAPDGYRIDPDNHKDIALEWGKTKTLIFSNTKNPALEILKVDAKTEEPLANAKFKITKTEDDTISEYMTDKNGKITIQDLSEGIYTIEEVSAPDGYILDTQHKEIELSAGDSKQLIYENTRKPDLIITKTNALTEKGIPNTTFKIEYESSSGGIIPLGTYKTDKNGQIIIENVNPGWYIITETRPAQGFQLPSNPTTRKYLAPGENAYSLNSGAGSNKTESSEIGTQYPQISDNNVNKPSIGNIIVTSGNDYNIGEEIPNYPLNSIVIKKTDANTSELLEGAVFEVRKVSEDISGNSGTIIGRYITDNSGIIVISGLEAGAYIIEEVKPPTNYLLSENSKQQAWLKADGTSVVEVVFTNYPYGSLLINKTDAKTNNPLAGARFKVTTSAGTAVGTGNGEFTTDSNGEILVPNLKPDSYIVTELEAPDGYVRDTTPQTVKIGVDGGTYKVSFQNQPESSLIILKKDSHSKKPLAGAKFKVTTAAGNVVGTGNGIFTTDENGSIKISNLGKDSYIIEEIEAPDGYLLKNQTKTVRIDYGKTYTEEFYNDPLASVIIKKYNSENKEPLSGARFKISQKSGNVIGEYTTDSNGLIQLDELTPGWYSAVEVKAPDGYLLNDTAKDFEVKTTNTITLEFPNDKLTSLIIKKIDDKSGEPLSGASFLVEKQNGQHIGEYTTDKTGTINIPTLSPDWYVVRETKAPEGYVLDETPKTVEVKTEVPTTVTFTNKKMTSLIIQKEDAHTGDPLSGAEFSIEKQNGERVGEYTTDKTGTINVPTLSPDWYVVRETKAPEGYVLDETPKTVEVKTNSPTVVIFENKPLSGIKIVKTDSKTGEPLEDVEFSISKMNGEKIGKFKTDKEGMIYISALEDGYYTITETEGLEGYHWDEAPITAEVKSGKQTIVEVENDPYSCLVIKKTNSKNGKPIEGVEFLVTKLNGEQIGYYETDESGMIVIDGLEQGTYLVKETKEAKGYQIDSEAKEVEIKDGKRMTLKVENDPMSSILIHKIDSVTKEGIYGVKFLLYDEDDNPIGQYESDNEGYVYINKELPEGKYKIRELQAADGYVLDDEVKTFYVKKGKTEEITWENTPTMGQIHITKKSSDDNPYNGFPAGTLLEGAKFEIYDRANNLFDTIVTDKNGIAVSKTLPIGRYIIREIAAPAYYSGTSEEIEAEIEFSGQIVRLEVYNQSVYTNVSITKRGYTEVVPGQSIKYEFKNIGNNSTVGLDSFYLRDTLPTDAARIDKIITGTWNQRLSYKITYKTNTNNDYRTLSDNLSTSKTYTIDASSAALGLASNEYVTEVMFSFGHVPAGFQQVETPYIYCNVLNGLPNNYQFANKADVGGLKDGQWIMANDRWVTKVYSNTVPPTLPRTGY